MPSGGGFHMSRTPSAAGEYSEDEEALTETEKGKSPALSGAAAHHHHPHYTAAGRRSGTRSRAGTGGKHYPMHPPSLPSPLHANFANNGNGSSSHGDNKP